MAVFFEDFCRLLKRNSKIFLTYANKVSSFITSLVSIGHFHNLHEKTKTLKNEAIVLRSHSIVMDKIPAQFDEDPSQEPS